MHVCLCMCVCVHVHVHVRVEDYSKSAGGTSWSRASFVHMPSRAGQLSRPTATPQSIFSAASWKRPVWRLSPASITAAPSMIDCV